jgi:tetratricopeptide (TPR) repeat protein
LALRQLGILSLIRGETDVARSLLEAGLAQARAAGNRVSEALNLWGLAQVAAHQDAFAEAHRAAEAALACLAEVGWRRGAVNVLGFLGDLSYWLADYPTARTQLEQCLALARDVGAEPLYCSALVRLGQVSIEMHDAGRAAALLEESLRASTRLGDRESLAAALAACAQLAAATGDAQRALRLASAAGALRTGPTVGGPISAVRTRAPAGEQAGRLAHARAMLGERAASRARVEGQALSWEAAAAEATAVCRSVGLLNGRHGTGPL